MVSVRSNGGYIGEDGRVKFARQQLVGAVFPSPMQVGASRCRARYPPSSSGSPIMGREQVTDGGASRVGESWESFHDGRVSVFDSLSICEPLGGTSTHMYEVTYSRNNPRRSS
jgi:hypothetical protein